MSELWCIYLPGPDELYAARSKADAERMMTEHNALMREFIVDHPRTENNLPEAALMAVVIPWPHSAEDHTISLSDPDNWP